MIGLLRANISDRAYRVTVPVWGFILLALFAGCRARGIDRLASIPGRFGAVAVSGDYVYLVGNSQAPGLKILELSEGRASPQVKAELPLPGGASDIVVGGSRAYVSCYPDLASMPSSSVHQLLIFDISDPSSPIPLSSFSRPAYARAGRTASRRLPRGPLALSDSIILWHPDLIDVSDPTAPVLLGSLELSPDDLRRSLGGSIRDVTVSGSLAYLAWGRAGLFIFDISEPMDPVLISNLASPHGAWSRGILVQGSRGYLSESFAGSGWIHILDLSEPSQPRVIHTFERMGRAVDVVASGSLLYVSHRGLKVFDISDLASPSLVGFYKAKGTPVYVSQPLIAFKRAGNKGVLILQSN